MEKFRLKDLLCPYQRIVTRKQLLYVCWLLVDSVCFSPPFSCFFSSFFFKFGVPISRSHGPWLRSLDILITNLDFFFPPGGLFSRRSRKPQFCNYYKNWYCYAKTIAIISNCCCYLGRLSEIKGDSGPLLGCIRQSIFLLKSIQTLENAGERLSCWWIPQVHLA